jgi:hypothetical protein
MAETDKHRSFLPVKTRHIISYILARFIKIHESGPRYTGTAINTDIRVEVVTESGYLLPPKSCIALTSEKILPLALLLMEPSSQLPTKNLISTPTSAAVTKPDLSLELESLVISNHCHKRRVAYQFTPHTRYAWNHSHTASGG